MKYLIGLMMAWGNFTAIPCPYKKWDNNARRAMLCVMPLMGVILGAIVIGAWALLDLVSAPAFLTGVLLAVLYFCGTGFIHLDGFMDCSDAILSRRPLEERQRILKDSAVGAFAVVAVVLILLVFAASMAALAEAFTLKRACVLIAIMAISRAIAAADILSVSAMSSSQYANIGRDDVDGGGAVDAVADEFENKEAAKKNSNPMTSGECIVLILTSVGVAAAVYFLISYSPWGFICCNEMPAAYMIYFCVVLLITAAAAYLIGFNDRKALGGMSGDIAGHTIVLSETIALAAAALLANILL